MYHLAISIPYFAAEAAQNHCFSIDTICILCFDTFERLAQDVVPWLLDYFLPADLNGNIVLVVAGRDPIERSLPDDPKRWLSYIDQGVIHQIELKSFTGEETRKYLMERGISDDDRIVQIWQLSRGLPLYLGLLTANPQGQIDPTADVVKNFLRWVCGASAGSLRCVIRLTNPEFVFALSVRIILC